MKSRIIIIAEVEKQRIREQNYEYEFRTLIMMGLCPICYEKLQVETKETLVKKLWRTVKRISYRVVCTKDCSLISKYDKIDYHNISNHNCSSNKEINEISRKYINDTDECDFNYRYN